MLTIVNHKGGWPIIALNGQGDRRKSRPITKGNERQLAEKMQTNCALEVTEDLTGKRATIPIGRFGNLVARSAVMIDTFNVLARLAPTNVTVTLMGETGAGKDVIAREVHENSARASAPFVVFDCGSVAPNLVESELLGHERGSFTGAVTAHSGAFERARGGTLFIDEVGELPLDLQPRLLRALENRTVRRVGGVQDIPVDVRVIAATNRDLKAEVASGKFRQDLYFRLAAALVYVPPLRERMEDLVLLTSRLLQVMGRPELVITDSAREHLKSHSWPGNVRELKNSLACAIAFSDGKALDREHFRFLEPSRTECVLEHLPLAGQTLRRLEQAAIKQTLKKTGGNKTDAARELGISVSTLYEKLKKQDI